MCLRWPWESYFNTAVLAWSCSRKPGKGTPRDNACDSPPAAAGMPDAAVGRKPRLGIPGQLLCMGLMTAEMTSNLSVQSSLGGAAGSHLCAGRIGFQFTDTGWMRGEGRMTVE